MMFRYLLITLCALAVSPSAMSASRQEKFVEDFQDGNAEGWKAGGKGTVQVTSYAGNYSLKLTKKAFALIMLPVAGDSTAHVSTEFAAANLEGKDACIAEVSSDKGAHWTEVNRVADGADDGITLHPGSGEVPTPTDGTPLIIRLRVDGNDENDTCWADNIQVLVSSNQSSQEELSGPRHILTAGFLLGNKRMTRPVPMSAFMPSSEAAPTATPFRGRLTFTSAPGTSSLDALVDLFKFTVNPLPGLSIPPSFTMEFVQDTDHLIPQKRGLIRTSNQAWDLFIEPGLVWKEPGDRGYSRAALPFSLQERNANCTHNGVMTFLFDPDGSMSRVVYQIASETCLYFKFNMWGTSSAHYEPGMVPDSQEIITAYRQEMSGRLPVKPIRALSVDHPTLNGQAFGAPSDITPEHMTTFGVIVDGVHYRGGCTTRYGPYPFCENVILPSYSVAKSVFAGLGMMRLEKLYPGAMQAKIQDYVPECADAGWKDVTFGQTLDMATGRYKSLKREVDEDAAVQDGFFIDLTHAEKIKRACNLYPKRTKPGRKWVYHTTDHYILGTAMQAFLREKQGPQADIFRDLLVAPIFKKIGLSPLSYKTRRTRDAVAQPFVGWGLSFLPDDYAKLGQFTAMLKGMWEGKALVDEKLLNAALQRDPDDPGLPAPDKHFRYNNGFWAWDAASFVKCGHASWIPFMSGYGGISVVLMPNDVIYYYVSDNDEYKWAHAIAASNTYKSMCKKGN